MNHIDSLINRFRPSLTDPASINYFNIHIDRYRYLLSKISKLNLPKNSRVLDIGCYPPHLFSLLKMQGFQVHGISSPHEPVIYPKIQVLNIENSDLPFSKNHFDLILLTELVEHLLLNPVPVLKNICRVLKPGGHFILTTPNAARLQNIVKLLIGQNIYFSLDQLYDSSLSTGSVYHRHNREYTLKELKKVIFDSSFNRYQGQYFSAYTPFRSKNQTDSFLLKTAKYLNFYISCIYPRFSDSIYIHAQK